MTAVIIFNSGFVISYCLLKIASPAPIVHATFFIILQS